MTTLSAPMTRRIALLTTLLVWLNGYPGSVRMYVPRLRLLGDLSKLAEGCKPGKDFGDFQKWAEKHISFIEENQKSETPYDKEWSQQRVEDIHAALESETMLTLGQEDPIKLRNIVMPQASHHTIFLLFDRPPRVKVGSYFPIEIRQLEARKQRIIGGLNARIEVVPNP